MAKKKANLITKEVAWSGDMPTMYQSMMEYQATEERVIRLVGDPKPTMVDAMDELCKEFMLWQEAMNAFSEAIK